MTIRNLTRMPIVAVIAFFFMLFGSAQADTLLCSITTQAACTGTALLRLSESINAHAELPSQSNTNYDANVVCCTGVSGLGNSCSGNTATFLKLQSVTNSHVEIPTLSNYTNPACISLGVGGSISVGSKQNNCAGYHTTLLSVESSTNSHAGAPSAYATKICATAYASQYLTFSISSNSVSFGTLSSVQTRYASSTNPGDTIETEAFNFKVSTNAPSGYFVTVQGDTLRYSAYTITSLENTNTAPLIGSEQFGIRATVSGSNGVVYPPYDASGFAFGATVSTASQVAYASVGDSATSTYSVRMVTNIATLTKAGPYTTNLTYVATANF